MAPLLALLVVGAGAVAASGAPVKVEVCHVPPNNPMSFHTILVHENALPRHLAHGDLMQRCFESCDVLCSDGNACTIDACDEVTEECLDDHPPVDCDDSNACTDDSCDPVAGVCVNEISVVCDDGDLCTIDACDPWTGECGFMEAMCDAGETCDPATGDCDAGGGLSCEIDFVALCVPVGECFDVPIAEGACPTAGYECCPLTSAG
jgi:hypothetical protein